MQQHSTSAGTPSRSRFRYSFRWLFKSNLLVTWTTEVNLELVHEKIPSHVVMLRTKPYGFGREPLFLSSHVFLSLSEQKDSVKAKNPPASRLWKMNNIKV